MLQVGVDVQRLGLMVVTGQPKNMAEYIQASSRVGRSTAGPGLVLTIYQWNRPRDLAHYEHFGYEHATFGRRVEGLTTTPFSKRALDRGLAGVLVGAVRHATDTALPNLGAHVATARRGSRRAAAGPAARHAPNWSPTPHRSDRRSPTSALRAARPVAAPSGPRCPTGQLGYEADAGAAAGLLREPDEVPWDHWSAPMSLRDVEPEVLLQLRRDDASWADRAGLGLHAPPAGTDGRHAVTAPARDPTRIGNARPSQLMTDRRRRRRRRPARDERHRPRPRRLGRRRHADHRAPAARAGPAGAARQPASPHCAPRPNDPQTADDPYTHVGVPVTTFPRWLRCPACYQLLPIDGVDQLELHHRYGPPTGPGQVGAPALPTPDHRRTGEAAGVHPGPLRRRLRARAPRRVPLRRLRPPDRAASPVPARSWRCATPAACSARA